MRQRHRRQGRDQHEAADVAGQGCPADPRPGDAPDSAQEVAEVVAGRQDTGLRRSRCACCSISGSTGVKTNRPTPIAAASAAPARTATTTRPAPDEEGALARATGTFFPTSPTSSGSPATRRSWPCGSGGAPSGSGWSGGRAGHRLWVRRRDHRELDGHLATRSTAGRPRQGLPLELRDRVRPRHVRRLPDVPGAVAAGPNRGLGRVHRLPCREPARSGIGRGTGRLMVANCGSCRRGCGVRRVVAVVDRARLTGRCSSLQACHLARSQDVHHVRQTGLAEGAAH